MNKQNPEYKKDDLIKFIKLSPKKKLEYLEKLNKFLHIATPKKNKKIWEILKSNGW